MRALQKDKSNLHSDKLTYILRASKFLVPNFTTYSTILEKNKLVIPTPGKCFYKAEITIKTLNTIKNSKYSYVHRFLPTFSGPDTVAISL